MNAAKRKLIAFLFRNSILVISGFSLLSCGGGRFINNPSTPPEIGISASNDDLNVTLNSLIIANTPGSWMKDAPWHEYRITIKTPPDRSLTIFKMALVDPTGVERPSGAHPSELEKASDQLSKTYKNQGISDAAAAGGMAASLLTAIPYIGPALNIAGMGVQHGWDYADAKEKEAIQAEFERRRLQFPLSLSDSANVPGSVFFPTIPNPKALIIEYRVGRDTGEMKTLKMPLENLQAR